ncbi:hypothetical protein [Photobacterium kishitanii]|uniref:Uncharacterized protein n=1 Tax=Photobacterium kishitanii TaxID=318456 RepID=A0A2T3KLM3_9GAMM|nr:hypothetical protein [Photobacterium kishitanii]PSV00576.1 hypothetical protein C9J27_05420 [Photobacterium kishitanii]
MKGNTFTNLILCSAIFVSTTSFAAIPNFWSFDFQMGNSIYNLANSDGQVVELSCTEMAATDRDDSADNSFIVTTSDGNDYDSRDGDISIVIDDTVYQIPSFTAGFSVGSKWQMFYDALSHATNFTVYVQSKEIGKFQAPAKNVAKAFNGNKCLPQSDWEW